MSRTDLAAPSPDGEWLAVVVQRPALAGEAYGRGYYELAPSRGDVWLISRRTGDRRNLTRGAATAAGFWCAVWSPDGRRLAMLSTAPEHAEPRGGDNVRLYVWDRATNALTRLNEAAMMTQTMGGSPLYRVDVRGGADGSTVAHRCSQEENAPFAWLDNRDILAITLPQGGVSALLDTASRPLRHAEEMLEAMRDGRLPTATAVSSGAAAMPSDERADRALIRRMNTATGADTLLAEVPAYPFRGELVLGISPDGHRAAVMATAGAIPPASGQRPPSMYDAWLVEKRLGFLDVTAAGPVRWVSMPPEARYPLELFGWSPDSRRIALRARARPNATFTPAFVASAENLSVARAASRDLTVGGLAAGSAYQSARPVLWVDSDRLIARGVQAGLASDAAPTGSRSDWWLLEPGAEPLNLTSTLPDAPAAFRRSSRGTFYTVTGNRLLALDVAAYRLAPVLPAEQETHGSIEWPRDPERGASEILVEDDLADGTARLRRVSLQGPRAVGPVFSFDRTSRLLGADPGTGVAYIEDLTPSGTDLREVSLDRASSRTLLSLNGHLARVDWGRTMLISYRSASGQDLKGAVILPAGYRPGRRYPVITWVYPGQRVRSLNDYWLDPYLPGIYNLRLYAARGYAVLIPSIPVSGGTTGPHLLSDIPAGVLPAVDRLVELGIADPERIGVMGQSFGGFAVYALVTQTQRFRAAVAMAGFTDLIGFYSQFDAGSRGYPGIEQEKSDNWMIAEVGSLGMGVPPYEDYQRYWSNSPLAFVDRVETPLLLVHGDEDVRAPMSQAESFFFSLYRQGKTARLLRYWGENHGLAQSPANVRNIIEESVGWFDRFLASRPGQDDVTDSTMAARQARR